MIMKGFVQWRRNDVDAIHPIHPIETDYAFG